MYEIWCLSYDDVTREVHPTARIDFGAETVGQFATQYFSENGSRIPIIGRNSINGSVKILGIPADAWGRGLTFIENVLANTVPHGWMDKDNSN